MYIHIVVILRKVIYLIGIDVTMFNNLLSKCKLCLSDCISESSKLQNNLKIREDCYNGRSLDPILSSSINNTSEFEKILDTLKSYKNTLELVEKSYMKQEELIASQLNNLSKKI